MKYLTVAILALLSPSSHAFAPLPHGAASRMTIALHSKSKSSSQDEKTLRKELLERNAALDEEEEAKFGVMDGANMQGAFTEDATPKPLSVDDTSSLEAKMEQMVQPRAYPLFLLEKGAEIVESTLEDATSFLRKAPTESTKKERLVVLGTGW